MCSIKQKYRRETGGIFLYSVVFYWHSSVYSIMYFKACSIDKKLLKPLLKPNRIKAEIS